MPCVGGMVVIWLSYAWKGSLGQYGDAACAGAGEWTGERPEEQLAGGGRGTDELRGRKEGLVG